MIVYVLYVGGGHPTSHLGEQQGRHLDLGLGLDLDLVMICHHHQGPEE